ncbi:MAG: DUF1684 domain-containing protein [Fimbriimonas sp.]
MTSLLFLTMLTQGDLNQELLQWRADQEKSIRKERGWLAVSGLYWLRPGVNPIGPGGIELPRAQGNIGSAVFSGGTVTLRIAKGLQFDGKPVTEAVLRPDSGDRAVLGPLTFAIIKRGTRTGIRLWDSQSEERLNFKGRKWYAPSQKLRIEAYFMPYDPPKRVPITNVLGDTESQNSPGYLSFFLDGKEYRLDTIDEGETLFVNFKDATSGKTTYPAGRFIDAPRPKNGIVILDFNKAYNPPCAFTNFATCPLPLKGNELPIPIPAGELTHHARVK